ncbi:uncharacterized protein [Miscanthus floridulus]|uniref:uncharacterized protein isoform X2 n=1 Tax=Miscanthus floridulus TaxID=154761 RepID=UPI00345AF9D9
MLSLRVSTDYRDQFMAGSTTPSFRMNRWFAENEELPTQTNDEDTATGDYLLILGSRGFHDMTEKRWCIPIRAQHGNGCVGLPREAKEAITTVLKDVLLDDDNPEDQFSSGSKALLNGLSSCSNLSLHIVSYSFGVSDQRWLRHRTWLVMSTTSTTSLAWCGGVV